MNGHEYVSNVLVLSVIAWTIMFIVESEALSENAFLSFRRYSTTVGFLFDRSANGLSNLVDLGSILERNAVKGLTMFGRLCFSAGAIKITPLNIFSCLWDKWYTVMPPIEIPIPYLGNFLPFSW